MRCSYRVQDAAGWTGAGGCGGAGDDLYRLVRIKDVQSLNSVRGKDGFRVFEGMGNW